jgi:hypothetical protein
VLISATHTHSSPRVLEMGLGEANARYHDYFAQRVADGIRRALNNLAPAKIGWGSGARPEYVFNRRWFVKPDVTSANPFGGPADQVQMNPSSTAALRPAGPVDPEIFVVSLQRLDGTPLAVLANYSLHYVGGVPQGQISSDYYGAFADRLGQLLGAEHLDPPFVAIMSNGTSGDVNNIDSSKPRERHPPYEKIRAVADGLAQAAVRIVEGITYRDRVLISVRTSRLELSVRRPDAVRLKWAEEVAAKTKPNQRLSRPEIYARETLRLAKYPAVVPVTLQAFLIGDLAIGAAPCEVFAETGLAIKEESPFPSTFLIELANGYGGYLPTPEQHRWGGYETWAARSSFLEVDAEPKIREALLDLLKQLSVAQRTDQ